jgi:Mrp family chromosome partitioning ATPase
VDLSELLDAVRRHIRIVIGMVLLAALVAALYVVFRRETRSPDTYSAAAHVQIPSRPAVIAGNSRPTEPAAAAPAGMPGELLREQDSLARSEAVRQQALETSGIPTNDTSVVFGAALNDIRDTITLTVTSNTAETTNKIIGNYVTAYIDARRNVSAQAIQAFQQGTRQQLQTLQARRSALESQLRPRFEQLPPVVVAPTQQSDAGGSASDREQEAAIPSIPPGADSEATLMLFERNALANRIVALQLAYADAVVNSNVPNAYAEVLDQGTAGLVPGGTQSPIVPVGIIMLVGLALGLAGAVLIDRRDHTIRSVRVASSTLSAPLLSTTPPPRRGKPEYAVLERPDSVRSAAFRKLAATCIATDRLPQAIMVSTPEGDAHDYVAANFAAALADLGLQVALVATSPRQSWYLEQFTVPVEGEGDLSQLLEQAHEQAQEGRFNGWATRHLAWTDLTSNLVAVPPAPDGALTVPLDGLPPFLESLQRSGVDVTVIAGPALLEDANATIVAWETRSVLWAVQVGTVTRRAASEAAARLELANVTPFGVVMVGAPEA